MSRGGKKKEIGGPERRCIVSGQSKGPSDLIRFVVSPDQLIIPDIAGKLPGRGIWVSSDKVLIEKAVEKNHFQRAAKEKVNVAENLASQVEELLAQRVINLMSLARKAGQAVAGYEKVKSLLESGQALVLVQAQDGSERGKGKLRPPAGAESLLSCLTSREIGLSFGRESVIHAALTVGGLGQQIMADGKRLTGVRIGVNKVSVRKEKTTHERK